METEMKDVGSSADSSSNRQQKKLKQLTDHDEMLNEISHLDANAFVGHLIDNVTDEVALEGLAGITFQALKLRLELRTSFEIEGFEDVAPALWNQIRRSKNFTYHLLPVPRQDLIPYTWDQYRDDRGIPIEPHHSPTDIYQYFPVEDKQLGIRGSSEHYGTRRDITYVVRRMSYLQAIQLFGNRLVIVATQVLREKALFGANYKKQQSLSIVQYCIMERIGRARHGGEITRGKISLACMKIPPKTQFYQRKALIKGKLLLRQYGSIKFAGCKCPAQVTVFHLPRFYKKIETVASLNTRTIFSLLNNSVDKCVSVAYVVSKYGKHTLRGLLLQFPALLETAWFQQDLEKDDSDIEEFDINEPTKRKIKQKTVRVLKLKITDVSVQTQILKRVLDGESAEDEKECGGDGTEQEDCESVNFHGTGFSDIQILRKDHFHIHISDCYFLFHALIRAGTTGLTLADLGCLALTQLESRSASRFLIRHGACKEGVVKFYKQKAFTYTLSSFANQAVRISITLQERFRNTLDEMAEIRQLLSKNWKNNKAVRSIVETDANINNTEEPSVSENFSASLPTSEYFEIDLKPIVFAIEGCDSGSNIKSKPSHKKKKAGRGASPRKTDSPSKSKPLSLDLSLPDQEPVAVQPIRMPSLCLVEVVENATNVTSQITPSSNMIESNKKMETLHEMGTDGSIEPEDNEPVSTSNRMVAEEIERDMFPESDEDVNPGEQFVPSRKGDAIDLKIRSRLNRQRVDWNEHDDRFILISYIATALFLPKCNFTKIFVFNSTQMRDLLLKRTNGKATKTSAAIRRRVHFLMHQKSFFDRYIGLMGAAVRDDYLYETYVKNHLQPPRLKIYINPPDDALENVVDYLYDKFDTGDFTIVDTRSSVNELETILFMRQLKRTEFYWKAMIFTIFCPMGKKHADRNRFKSMWRRLSRTGNATALAITEEVSDKTTTDNSDLAQEGNIPIVDHEEETGDKDTIEINEPIDDVGEIDEEEKKTPEEYYNEYCFRYFKFLLKQLKIVFNNMLMLGSVRNSKEFQLICFDPNLLNSSSVGSVPNICFSSRECNSEAEIRVLGARCLVLDYVISGDSTKVLDKSVVAATKLPLEKAASSLTSTKVLLCSKRTGLLVLARQNLRQFLLGLTANSYDETLEFLTYIDEASNVDSLACISVGILFGIVELTDYFTASINAIESIFTLNDEWAPVYDGISHDDEALSGQFPSRPRNSKRGKKRRLSNDSSSNELPSGEQLPLKGQRLTREEEEDIEDLIECFEDIEKDMFVRKSKGNVGLEEGENYISSSTNALRLLRIRLNQAGVHMPRKQFTGFVEKDFFTINLPSLEFVFPRRHGLNHRIAGTSHPYPYEGDKLKELRSTLVELVYHNVERSEANDSTQVQQIEKHLKKYGILFELINLAGKVGVSGTFLGSKFEYGSLIKGLRYLLNCKLIFSVGVVNRRFVSYNNVNDWIIPIRQQVGGSVVGHAIVRPWITALGAISWQTVNRLFASLLGQLQKPALPFDELCESLSPTLNPVEVIILIETFVRLKYLTVYKVHEEQTTMFSKHQKSKTKIEYNVDTLIDTDNIFVAVSPYTTFLFSQLQNAIQMACYRRQPIIKKPRESREGDKYLLNKKRRKRKINIQSDENRTETDVN